MIKIPKKRKPKRDEEPFPGIAFHADPTSPHFDVHDPFPGIALYHSYNHSREKSNNLSVEDATLSLSSGADGKQGKRPHMEDRHVIEDLLTSLSGLPPVSFYAVYDGHGGDTAAAIAAEKLHGLIVASPAFARGEYEQAIAEGMGATDQIILVAAPPVTEDTPPLQRAEQNESMSPRGLRKAERPTFGEVAQIKKKRKVGGTCVVAALVIGKTMLVANVGDCEAVLASIHPCPCYRLLTVKHKPTFAPERERIERLGGTVLYGRLFGDLAVSRALGDAAYKKPFLEEDLVTCTPHIVRVELTPEDGFLLMACDGLWDKCTYSEAVLSVAKLRAQGLSPVQICQNLADGAIEKGSKDNVTVLVIFFNWEPVQSSAATDTEVGARGLGGWVRASISEEEKDPLAEYSFGTLSLGSSDTLWKTAGYGGLTKWKEKRTGLASPHQEKGN